MKKVPAYKSADLRNIVLLGALGAGKTTLAEALLHRCGAIGRMGSVEAGTTASAHDPDAARHHHSTASTLLFATNGRREINLLDTPGHPELVGQALAALPVVETALIVVSAAAGVEDGAKELFRAAGEAGLARMIVVNKIDLSTPPQLRALLLSLREAFGPTLHCMNLPAQSCSDVVDCFDKESGAVDLLSVGEVHRELVEAVVEVDDAKLERYLAGEPIDLQALRATVVQAMVQGHVVPIVFTSARKEVGVDDLLHILGEEAPSPVSGRPRKLLEAGKPVEIPCDPAAPLLAHVFKLVRDPKLGTVALLRVLQGRLDGVTPFVCGEERKPHKPGHVLKLEGREHPELEAAAFAGDLVALAHVEGLHVDQLLHAPESERPLTVIRPTWPAPTHALKLSTANRSDEGKLATALLQLVEEDPTLTVTPDAAHHAQLLAGLGEHHLALSIERLKLRFQLDLSAKPAPLP